MQPTPNASHKTPRPSDAAIRYADLVMPKTGERTKVCEGVYWIRMPLPFALDHINLWLIRDCLNGQEGWTVVDTGVSNDATRAAWHALADHHMDGLPVVRVICTHFHPDHIGLAYWLCKGMERQTIKPPLWINYAEYASARIWSGSGPKNTHGNASNTSEAATVEDDAPDSINMATHFHRHGVNDADTLAKLRARRGYYPSMVPDVPASFHRMFPDTSICIGNRSWRVIAGYGHSPEHCALFCQELNVLISGDMVLPKISTNMSVWAQEPDADPLRLYLDSLDAFEPLPDDVLVLPSHGKPFGAAPGTRDGGLKTRLHELRKHHADRLADTLEACATPRPAIDVMKVLFRRELDLHQLTFALGETIAHLNCLWHDGQLDRHIDTHGRIKFQTRVPVQDRRPT